MKFGYLIFAVVLTVAILIVAFQNIAVTTRFWLFFQAESIRLTLPIMFLSALGMIAGAFYTLFIQSVLAKRAELEREESEGDF